MCVEKKYDLSIIVPIYNVEKFIEECAKSLFDQILADYNIEIIFIDDGSRDLSISILKDLIDKQKLFIKDKIKLINQENKGLSGARNTGIRNAFGNYIYFLDSDDLVSPEFLSTILPLLDDDIQLIEFNAIFFHENETRNIEKEKNNIYLEGLHIIVDEDQRAEYFAWQDWAVWYRVYHRSIWENRFFPEGELYEDAMTIPFIYNNINKVYSLNRALVKHRYNSNSIMNSKNLNSIKSINYGLELFENYKKSIYLKIVANRFSIASVGVLVRNFDIVFVKKWIEHKFIRLDYKDFKYIHSFKLKLINLNPYFLLIYFSLKYKR